jgi:hypothetical protein
MLVPYLEFIPGRLTSFHFIHSFENGFYELPPPICGIKALAIMPG